MKLVWSKIIQGRIKPLLVFLLILSFGIFGFIVFKSPFFSEHKDKTQQAKIHYEKEMSASGVSFVEYKDSRKRFSFKTKEINVSRKKLGFLRLGFFKVVEIEDLKTKVYSYDDEKTSSQDSLDLNNYILNNESVQLLNLDNVYELKIRNFYASFYKNGDLILSIKSDKAGFVFYKKNLVFSENVILRAGNGKILQCQNLKYLREKKQFQTKGQFRLISDIKVIEGKGLVIDSLLKDIESISTVQNLDIDLLNLVPWRAKRNYEKSL